MAGQQGHHGGDDQNEHQQILELLQKNPDDALLFTLCQGIGAAFQCDLPGLLLGQSFGRRVKLPQDVLAGAVIIRRHMHPPYTRVV